METVARSVERSSACAHTATTVITTAATARRIHRVTGRCYGLPPYTSFPPGYLLGGGIACSTTPVSLSSGTAGGRVSTADPAAAMRTPPTRGMGVAPEAHKRVEEGHAQDAKKERRPSTAASWGGPACIASSRASSCPAKCPSHGMLQRLSALASQRGNVARVPDGWRRTERPSDCRVG